MARSSRASCDLFSQSLSSTARRAVGGGRLSSARTNSVRPVVGQVSLASGTPTVRHSYTAMAQGKGLSSTYDVCVFGAGPAGIATAMRLRRADADVVVLDRLATASSPWAGESLPGTVGEPLGELGVRDRFLAAGHVPGYEVRVTWGTPEPRATPAILRPHGHGWHVDRSRFDADLRSGAAEAGCALRRYRRLVDLRRDGGATWCARLDDDRVIGASFLVDATGRCCAIARRLGARQRRFDDLVALVARVPRNPDPADGNALVLESTPDGWWYAAPVPGAHVLAYLTDRDLRDPAWRPSGMRVAAACSALIESDQSAAEAGWLAAGDAFAAHDPLCGWGVERALRNGLLAGDAIAAFLSGKGTSRLDSYGAPHYAPAVHSVISLYDTIREQAIKAGTVANRPSSTTSTRYWCGP